MTIEIRTESPLTEDGRNLVAASEAYLRQFHAPHEECSISPDGLASRNAQFLIARLNGASVGCVAMLDQGTYAEVKCLFVRPEARGMGVSHMLMDELERATRDIGLVSVRLENSLAMRKAVDFYRSLGFNECAAFGDHPDTGDHMFFEKKIGVELKLPHRNRCLQP